MPQPQSQLTTSDKAYYLGQLNSYLPGRPPLINGKFQKRETIIDGNAQFGEDVCNSRLLKRTERWIVVTNPDTTVEVFWEDGTLSGITGWRTGTKDGK